MSEIEDFLRNKDIPGFAINGNSRVFHNSFACDRIEDLYKLADNVDILLRNNIESIVFTTNQETIPEEKYKRYFLKESEFKAFIGTTVVVENENSLQFIKEINPEIKEFMELINYDIGIVNFTDSNKFNSDKTGEKILVCLPVDNGLYDNELFKKFINFETVINIWDVLKLNGFDVSKQKTKIFPNKNLDVIFFNDFENVINSINSLFELRYEIAFNQEKINIIGFQTSNEDGIILNYSEYIENRDALQQFLPKYYYHTSNGISELPIFEFSNIDIFLPKLKIKVIGDWGKNPELFTYLRLKYSWE